MTPQDQLRYDRWIARAAHRLGPAVFQKNDPEHAGRLERYFDGVLDDQCNQYRKCGAFPTYLNAGQPVLNAEGRRCLFPGFCAAEARARIMGALYGLALNGRVYRACWAGG